MRLKARRHGAAASVSSPWVSSFSLLSLLVLLLMTWAPAARAQAGWPARLQADLALIDAQQRTRIGVYVKDLDTGVSASYQAERLWYLASTVKVPVAIAVLRGVESGKYTLDTTVTVRASDYVDGAGLTNHNTVGTPLSIRYLMEQMIINSDNTATDMLISLVGIAELNAMVESLVPTGFRRITELGEIRRLVYGYLAPGTERLAGQDLLALNRQKVDSERLKLLARMIGTPVDRFRLPTLDAAYDAYYATGLNSARLDAYGQLLILLAEGKALTPAYTDYLLKLMESPPIGPHRVRAGLPMNVQWAHKTGTQRRRSCDSGLIRWSEAGLQRRAVVAACTRDEPVLERSEYALMQVGQAICRSGLITKGIVDAPSCHVLPLAGPLPAGSPAGSLR